MNIRDERKLPNLSVEELREMFYGPVKPHEGREPSNMRRLLTADAADAALSSTDRLTCFVLSLVVLFGSWGMLYVLYRIAVDCLRRLGL